MNTRLAAVVDRYWAGVFGCPAEALWPATATVTAHAPDGLGDYRGIYVLACGAAVRISVPAPLLAEVSAVVSAGRPGNLLDAAFWRAALGDRIAAVHGPSVHHYLDAVPRPGVEVREVPAGQLELLRSACPEADWTEGGFGEPDGRCFGRWVDGSLVAAGNLTLWRGQPSDVGLVTHPDHRGRGYAGEVARHVTRVAVETAGVARYRALTTNTASLAVARRLGFSEYGRNIGIRLTPLWASAIRPRE
ncbi:MAG TPA: GNAT family N-acetyltransferase [Mycobacteriales bacterium]|jgi:RimJ/RimL family protein N-acetyltransferase|nr:GNAT family N-acetyltransferase [Mycobacteriales bacterium]